MIGLFAKAMIEIVTSAAVGAACGNVFRAVSPVVAGSLVKRGLVTIGEAILTSMIAAKATDHLMERVEKLAVKISIKPVEEPKKEE